MTNLLVTDAVRGRALAASLGNKAVVLMSGHGVVVVGPSVRRAVVRAVYAQINATLQMQALNMSQSVTYLSPEEGAIMEKYFDDAEKGHATDRFWENIRSGETIAR